MRIRNLWVAMAAVIAAALTTASAQTVTVFSDNFTGGSTVNSGNAPTANSTSYDLYGNKAHGALVVGQNDLNGTLTSTGSGGTEFEALFSSSAINLNSGDWLDFQVAFTDTSNLLASVSTLGTGDTLMEGLFYSGGVAPLTTNGTSTAFVPGGVQNWQGYAAKFVGTASSSTSYTRPKQTAGVDQELLGNNLSSSGTYSQPTGTTLTTGAVNSHTIFTNLAQYTMEMLVTNTGSGIGVDANLYEGLGTTGTVILAMDGVDSGNLATEFDGMAFGWWQKGTQATAMDVSSVLVTTDVPEPSTLVLIAAGLAMVLRLVWRRR